MRSSTLLRCLSLALLVGSVSSASADTAGTTFLPPYQRGSGIGAMHLSRPCSVGRNPIRERRSDASSGRLDTSAGVAANGCAAYTTSIEQDWVLGAVPITLVGQPARITAIVDVGGASTLARGTGDRAAAVNLTIADGATWTLVSVSCTPRCTETRPSPGILRFETTIASLPPTLRATIGSRASMSKASGAVAADLTGFLRSVTVTPLLGLP